MLKIFDKVKGLDKELDFSAITKNPVFDVNFAKNMTFSLEKPHILSTQLEEIFRLIRILTIF
jgi:hypothetical protein